MSSIPPQKTGDTTASHRLEDASALLRFSKSSASPEITKDAVVPNPLLLGVATNPLNPPSAAFSASPSPASSVPPVTAPSSGPYETQKGSQGPTPFGSSPAPQSPNLSSTSNPGPAVAALSASNSQSDGVKKEHSMKAIVAAAALAAAASTPLPLNNNYQAAKGKIDLQHFQAVNPHNPILSNVVPLANSPDVKLGLGPELSGVHTVMNSAQKPINTATGSKPSDTQQRPPLSKKPSAKDKATKSDKEKAKDKDKSRQKEKEKEKEKEKSKPAPKKKEIAIPSYAVDPDAGIIDCICRVNEDDGFTIQCDKCFRWQHASCFNIMTNDVPDIYYCERCDPKSFKTKNINVKEKRDRQLGILPPDVLSRYEEQFRQEADSEESNKRKIEEHLGDANDESRKKKRTALKEQSSSSSNISKDKKDQSQSKESSVNPEAQSTNNNNNVNINNVASISTTSNEVQKDINSTQSTTTNTSGRKEKSRKKKREEFDDNTNEELITRIESAKDEYYYAVYHNLKKMEYRNKSVEKYVTESLPKVLNESLIDQKEPLKNAKISALKYSDEEFQKALSKKPSIFVKNILLNNSNSGSSSHYKFSGLSNLGIFLKGSPCEKGQLVEEFLGEVDYQLNYFKNSINQFKYWGLPKNYYFFVNYFEKDYTTKEDDEEKEDDDRDFGESSDSNDPQEKEDKDGDVKMKNKENSLRNKKATESSTHEHPDPTNLAVGLRRYIVQSRNLSEEQHNKLLVPIFINCKTSGNELRYIRKSCFPNCQIVPVLVGDNVKFCLQAIKPIGKEEELTVGWEFDFNNLYSKLYSDGNIDIDKHNDFVKSNFNSKLSNGEKVQLINQVEFILGQYKCGCYSVSSNVNNIKCKLLRIKKMGSYFYRSSRKGSKLSKVDAELKDENNINQQLIRSRLLHRDQVIESTLDETERAQKAKFASLSANDNNNKDETATTNGSNDNNTAELTAKNSGKIDKNPFKPQKKKDLIEHPKKRFFVQQAVDYAILNSRAQLAKAIIANCLSIPVPVKSALPYMKDYSLFDEKKFSKRLNSNFNLSKLETADTNKELEGGIQSSSKADDAVNKKLKEEHDTISRLKRENSSSEVKKVKKMSFADFLKHKSN